MIMPITHVNAKGKTYYLHQGVTKTGKPKYHFAMKSDGTYRKFKGHFNTGPSGAQPAKRPLEYPGSGKVAVVFTPRHHGMS
jgi:hypothetical protein